MSKRTIIELAIAAILLLAELIVTVSYQWEEEMVAVFQVSIFINVFYLTVVTIINSNRPNKTAQNNKPEDNTDNKSE